MRECFSVSTSQNLHFCLNSGRNFMYLPRVKNLRLTRVLHEMNTQWGVICVNYTVFPSSCKISHSEPLNVLRLNLVLDVNDGSFLSIFILSPCNRPRLARASKVDVVLTCWRCPRLAAVSEPRSLQVLLVECLWSKEYLRVYAFLNASAFVWGSVSGSVHGLIAQSKITKHFGLI
jgi:hypothetical protein